MKKPVTIWSEGTRIAGDLFVPDDLKEGEKRPAILLCHGWAGPKSHLSATYAPFFCEAGFICLTFDYRGWYESDARLVTMDKQPEPDGDGMITVRARPVVEVVDALEVHGPPSADDDERIVEIGKQLAIKIRQG